MKEYRLKIDGMMCGMCENHLKDIIRKNFEVNKIKSSYKKKEIVVSFSKELDKDKLKTVIDETGYILESIDEDEYSKKALFGLFK